MCYSPYSMPLVTAQVSIPTDLPNVGADFVTNTWGFFVNTADVAGVTNAQAALDTFYTSVAAFFGSDNAQPNAVTIKWYDLSDPTPRVPFAQSLGTVGFGNGTSPSLPPECAICLSFQGAPVSGVSQARRRGRIFFGPLATNAIGSNGRVSSSALSSFATAATTLLSDSGASGWQWCVVSRASGSPVAVFVTDGWIDDAIDIQHRRGHTPSSRTLFSV